MSLEQETDLGPCCNCGTRRGVVNIMMLDRRAPVAGCGWGCVVCGLPSDGAVAVLCDDCVDQEVRFVCEGYPSSGKRVPFNNLSPDKFAHADIPH